MNEERSQNSVKQPSIAASIWTHSSSYRVILLFCALAFINNSIPWQHFYQLSRCQHFGSSLFIAGLG
ncbi:MAG TPA: hypothetical protein V6C72_18670, partial [Chroococcales cyanobacterium]